MIIMKDVMRWHVNKWLIMLFKAFLLKIKERHNYSQKKSFANSWVNLRVDH